MKKTLLFLSVFTYGVSLFAQSKKENKAYADELLQIQNAVWGYAPAEFKETKIPADLTSESAVILAKSFNLSRVSSGKIEYVREIGLKTHPTKFSIFHERVKINDKVALESFSTVEYQKKLDRSTRHMFSKTENINNMFIGAKVIKPDGKEIIVNTNEEVLTKNEEKDRESKLAISELQVGDILDYFVCREDIVDKEVGNLYEDNDNLFELIGEYPVLHYTIDFQFNKGIKIKTIYANGAQHFEERQNSDGDQFLSLILNNLPKYQSRVWTSEFRQYPYIEIGSAYDDEIDGIIKKNNFSGDAAMLQAQKYSFEKLFNGDMAADYTLQHDFKEYLKKNNIAAGQLLDSTMKALYAMWKYDTFCKFSTAGGNGDLLEISGNRPNSKAMAIKLSKILASLKINFDVLLVASRTSNTLNCVFNMSDFEALVRINADKPLYMFADDIFTQFDEVPERFQGEKAIVLHPQSKNGSEFTFTEGEDTLPVMGREVNNNDEHIKVSLADQNMQKLKIERLVRQRGALRYDDQHALLTIDAFDNILTSAAANGVSMDKRFKNLGDYKKFVGALQAVFDKARDEKVKNFTAEIKDKFEQEPQQVNNCKIISAALDKSQPVFAYSEDFVLDNMVKKAGDNLLIDVGKLTGGFYKLDDKERKRDVDIYMQCARSFNYTISIVIPPGFSAKGMEELTIKKENKTGSFSSGAVIKGNILTISVSRTYTNNFEKVADWPLMVDILDAASNFTSAKILLEKNAGL